MGRESLETNSESFGIKSINSIALQITSVNELSVVFLIIFFMKKDLNSKKVQKNFKFIVKPTRAIRNIDNKSL